MPEGLTQTKTPTSKNPAGFKSECRPVSFRNRGRLQIGTMAGFKSEYPAGINRNPHHSFIGCLPTPLTSSPPADSTLHPATPACDIGAGDPGRSPFLLGN